jgi:hypothetical protein
MFGGDKDLKRKSAVDKVPFCAPPSSVPWDSLFGTAASFRRVLAVELFHFIAVIAAVSNFFINLSPFSINFAWVGGGDTARRKTNPI